MKKILSLILIGLIGFSLLACTETTTEGTTTSTTTNTTTNTTTETTTQTIEINVDTDLVTIKEGENYQLVVTSNDAVGLTYSVNVAGIINLSDTGYIQAVAEGVAIVTIRSQTDSEVFQNVTVEVRRQIEILSDTLELNMVEGDTRQLVIDSNGDYTFEVTNSEIASVSEDGLVLAKAEGSTTIVVTSTYDEDVSIAIDINVTKLIVIDVEKTEYVLVVGDTENVLVTSNEGLSFLSGNNNVVTVNQEGLLEAVGFGTTTVYITSTYNDDVTEAVTVTVYKYTEGISITGTDLMIKGMVSTLTVNTDPVGAFGEVTWQSTDETVLTVDDEGNVTAVSSGSASIIATSTLDTELVDTFNITVVNVLIVDQSKHSGDTYTYESLELTFGEQLFNSIAEALDVATEDTFVYIDNGTYQEGFSILQNGISLIGIGDNVILECDISVFADNVEISNLKFTGNSLIHNSATLESFVAIDSFVFKDNVIESITTESPSFIWLNDVSNVQIIGNTFQTLVAGAIDITDFKGLKTEIKDNIIDDCTTAITLDAVTELDSSYEVRIFWNTISNVDLAFDIDMLANGIEQDVFKVARFNNITNYVNAITANEDSTFDFTLNYWGFLELDCSKFINVDPYYLNGSYTDPLLVPTEASYNPTVPIRITVLNPIEEIMIGESHQFEYEILPYELSDAPIRFITGFPDLVAIDQTGIITPLSSGDVYIQVRSAQVSSIRTQVDFSIITTPGIELTTSNVYSDIQVGDEFTLDTILFPYTIENETSTIISSAPSVASIGVGNVVTCHAEGLVTFTASLDSDPSVYVEYTVYVHGSLDPDNSILDYLTVNQISYSSIHEWVAYGFQYNYYDTRAESVSRYYFGDIPINDSKLVPVFYAIRPGEPMDPLPDGVTGYNPYNVYWIVVHDTASTALGSNALAHANYLYNNTMLENELWVSWHFTIDDHDIYQHLPEIERGFHAGDGSTRPTLGGTYLGGGNRNGIGIEMAINEDGDLYRTWQRTAKLVAYLLDKYNLPISQQQYHNGFSGKDCPRTLRNAGLVPLFEEFVAAEYYIKTNYPDAEITFTSNNPDYLDDYGRIIQIPQRALTVSYTITVTNGGVTESRTFYTYLPGTVR